MAMFTFRYKKIPFLISKNLGWLALGISLIIFAYVFLFVYKHVYFAIVQDIAISNLRSELVISKVNKPQFDQLIQSFNSKKNPASMIDFSKISNPFASINISDTEEAR